MRMHGVNVWLDIDGQPTDHMKSHLMSTVNDHAFMAASTGYVLDDALRNDADRHVFAAVEQIVLYGGRISAMIKPLESTRKLDPELRAIREARAHFMSRHFVAEKLSTLHARLVRNRVEHYDERVEETVAKADPGAGWVEDMIGPRSAIIIEDSPRPIWQRRFDPDTGEFELLGETTNIQALMSEIHTVHDISTAWIKTHRR